MKRFSTLLSLVAAVLLMSAWSGSAWAQEGLQLTAGNPQVTQDFNGMFEGGAATLNMPEEIGRAHV